MSVVGITLARLAEELGAELHGDGDIEISGIGTLKSAGPAELSFFVNPKYRQYLQETRAAAVICAPDQASHSPVPALAVDNPYAAFARATHYFDRSPRMQAGIHPAAAVADSAEIHASAAIGANAVIEEDVKIGAEAVIMPNVYVGAGTVIGEQVRLWPNVTIYHGVRIGPRSVIHANSVVGSDGFGFAPEARGWTKIAQLGGVRIGSDVDIGACTTIDRGAIEDTVIEDGAIIDNQVQIAHNVVIGKHTALAGKVGISGSSIIGSNCMLGGAVGVAGHLEITDNVHVLGMSLVSRSIKKPGVYASSVPVSEYEDWRKNTARLRRLNDLFQRVKNLEKK